MKRVTVAFIAAWIGAGSCSFAADTGYPSRAVRVIVPYQPGGNQDIVARAVGQKLSEIWGRPIVVDNRPGGGTNIGAEMVVRAAPDAYTLYQGGIANAINMTLYRKLSYDFARDFAPICLMTVAPTILVVHPSVPAKTVKELVALAKAQPGKLTYAAAGIGSSPHLSGELFRMLAGVDIIQVQYKGGGGVIVDLLAGHVQMYFGTMPSALPHVKVGKLRALALMSDKRSSLVPDLPTAAEAGLPGMEISVWSGMMAPKGTPRPILDKIQKDLSRVLADNDLKEKLAVHGLETVGGTPAEYAAFIQSEISKYAKVIRFANIQPD